MTKTNTKTIVCTCEDPGDYFGKDDKDAFVNFTLSRFRKILTRITSTISKLYNNI